MSTSRNSDVASSDLPLLSASSARQVGPRELCVVAAIAVFHMLGTQVTQAVMTAGDKPSPYFATWFATGWNVLLALPLALPSQRRKMGTPDCCGRAALLRALLTALPFYIAWAGANTLYVAALASLQAGLVAAVFAATPALVAILSIPVLGRRLTPLAGVAVAASVVGVVLIAEPWRRHDAAAAAEAPPASSAAAAAAAAAEAPSEPSKQLLATLCVLGASCCAACYKVFFRRVFGDAPALVVLSVLAMIGLWSLGAGTLLLLLVDSHALSRGAGLGRDALLGLAAKSALDLGFNFFVAFGISLTHPLFISVGTLLSTPLNVAASYVLHGQLPTPVEDVGMLCILSGFALLLLDEFGGCERLTPAAAAAQGGGSSSAAAAAAAAADADAEGAHARMQ